MIAPLFWLAGFWVAILEFAAARPSARDGLRFLVALTAGATAAHLGWAALHADVVARVPAAILDPTRGFCVLFLPAGVLACAPWRADRLRLDAFLAAVGRSLPLACAVARLGCWLGGCCGGLPLSAGSDGWIAGSHPTALYEIVGLLVLRGVLTRLGPDAWLPATLAGVGVLRLAIEPVRVAPGLGAPAVPVEALAAGWIGIAAALAVRTRGSLASRRGRLLRRPGARFSAHGGGTACAESRSSRSPRGRWPLRPGRC